jgi:hypothetical protein
VFALFAAVTAIFFWPWMAHPGAALIGPPEDNLQDFWNSWYAAAAPKPHGFFFTDIIRYPEGMKLTYHSFAYPQVFAVAALAKIFGSGFATLVLLQNLTLLASFPLAGLGTYYVVRHFNGNELAGLVGGFVFAFNPSHVAHTMHHAHVASIEFLPFFVIAYLLAIERRHFGWLACAIAFWTLSALSSWYYLFYIGYFVVFHAVYLMARDNAVPKGWRLFAPLASAAGTLVLLAPLLMQMAMEHANPHIYAGGGNEFVADLAGLVLFPPAHLLSRWTSDLNARLSGNAWEAVVYLGLVNLAVLTFFRIRVGRDATFGYALWGMVVFFLIAGGETLHVLGMQIPFLHLPSLLLSKLPFLANVRTPSRAIVFVYLFLAIAIGRAATLAQQSRQLPAMRWGMGIAGALMVLDFYPAHLDMTPMACPAGLSVIHNDADKNFGVLNLPWGYVEGNFAMAMQPCHGRPIAQGNVARQLYPTLADRLEMTDLGKQKHELEKAKIKYVVINKQHGQMFVWPGSGARKSAYGKIYATVYDDNDLTVLRVY